jgi:hypothetical protein
MRSHRIRDYQAREFERAAAGEILVSKLIITEG